VVVFVVFEGDVPLLVWLVVLEVLFEVDELRVVFWIAGGLSGVVLLVGNIVFCGRFGLAGLKVWSEFPVESVGV
jgi:hypothetical protein